MDVIMDSAACWRMSVNEDKTQTPVDNSSEIRSLGTYNIETVDINKFLGVDVWK